MITHRFSCTMRIRLKLRICFTTPCMVGRPTPHQLHTYIIAVNSHHRHHTSTLSMTTIPVRRRPNHTVPVIHTNRVVHRRIHSNTHLLQRFHMPLHLFKVIPFTSHIRMITKKRFKNRLRPQRHVTPSVTRRHLRVFILRLPVIRP